MTVGRPSKYKPEFVEQAKKLCELGATDREIAHFFKVKERTVYRWLLEFPEFCHALKMGKDVADSRVERSLYRKALGYTHDAVHVSNYMGNVTLTPIIEHIAPDTTAAIFWLKNRKPSEWRDVKAVEHSGSLEHRHVTELTDAEIISRLERIRVADRIAGEAQGEIEPLAVHPVHDAALDAGEDPPPDM